jgi:hypothetical protein
MVEAGAVLVPTRFIVQHLVDHGRASGMPDYAYAKITAIADRHFEAMQTAIAAGVHRHRHRHLRAIGPGVTTAASSDIWSMRG